MNRKHISTDELKRACEDGSFCHDTAFQIAEERDALRRALAVAIHEQGRQFKQREILLQALKSLVAGNEQMCLIAPFLETGHAIDMGYLDAAREAIKQAEDA